MSLLIKKISQFFQAKKQAKQFFNQKYENRKIVFYAEDDFSYIHYKGLINKLTNTYKQKVSYLTSQINDPVFELNIENLNVYYIGSGIIRTSVFYKIDSIVFIMTMPDLETFHLKRSKVLSVEYVYLFHALVSTFSNYRKSAFDNYDTIFLTSYFQANEIRAAEKKYNLPSKRLIEYGYPQLELLISEVKKWRNNNHSYGKDQKQKKIILAPSWGVNGVLETVGMDVISILLDEGYFVTVRPHPCTTRQRSDVINNIMNEFSALNNFQLQTDIKDKVSIYSADIMISDWSGVAMEYAFACERPVIYIDVPKKCLNPDAEQIGMIPIEVSIREKIGVVLSPDELYKLPEVINDCLENKEKYIKNAIDLRSEYVFNLHSSIDIGSEYLYRQTINT